jgi:uncharacterized protein (DUF2062 family)
MNGPQLTDMDFSAMRKKTAQFVKRLLALDDTPERIARAFALGVFLAFSPFIGLHAILGLGVVLFCGLNRAAFLLGLFINNPWTLVPIYAAGTFLGGLLMGFPSRPTMPELEWKELFSGSFWGQMAGQWPMLKPMVLGSFVLSILLSALSYLIALHLIKQRRAHQQ